MAMKVTIYFLSISQCFELTIFYQKKYFCSYGHIHSFSTCTNFTSASPGCSSRFLLWEADVPPVQLECPGWLISVRVSGGYPSFSGLQRGKQDPGHPQSPPPAAHATPTQVRSSATVDAGFPVLILTSFCVSLSAFSRVISRAPGLKLVVETLITSLRPIGNIVLICCAFFIIFGILGVQVVYLHSGFSHRTDVGLYLSMFTSDYLGMLSYRGLISLNSVKLVIALNLHYFG